MNPSSAPSSSGAQPRLLYCCAWKSFPNFVLLLLFAATRRTLFIGFNTQAFFFSPSLHSLEARHYLTTHLPSFLYSNFCDNIFKAKNHQIRNICSAPGLMRPSHPTSGLSLSVTGIDLWTSGRFGDLFLCHRG